MALKSFLVSISLEGRLIKMCIISPKAITKLRKQRITGEKPTKKGKGNH